MTLLDVIDLDKIWIVNSMWEPNFLSHGQKWARLWFGITEKINIKKKNFKQKLLNIMVPNFLYRGDRG